MTLPSGYWHDLTTTDLAALDPARCVALLPLGAVEQHGPHLPLVTDTCIAEGLVAETLARIDDDMSLLVLPTLAVGASAEHLAYAGTLSLAPATLARILGDLGASLAASGLRKLIVLNTHGGNRAGLDTAALDLRRHHGMLVVKANIAGLGMPEGLFDADELDHGIHGGAVETALMLHLRPDLVRMEAAECFDSASLSLAADYRHLRPTGRLAYAWLAQDLNPAGVVGRASGATAETGRRLLDHMAGTLAGLAAEVARVPLEDLLGDDDGTV